MQSIQVLLQGCNPPEIFFAVFAGLNPFSILNLVISMGYQVQQVQFYMNMI
jgi:hypothetical protein